MTGFHNYFLGIQMSFKFHGGKHNLIRMTTGYVLQNQIATMILDGLDNSVMTHRIALTFMQFKFSEIAKNAATDGTLKGSVRENFY